MGDKNSSRTTLICDLCGSYGEKNTEGPFNRGSLHILRTIQPSSSKIDRLGGRNRNFDFCQRCTDAITRTMESLKPAALAH